MINSSESDDPLSFHPTKLKGHKSSVSTLMTGFHHDILFSGGEDNTVRLWDCRTNRSNKCILNCIQKPVSKISVFPDDLNHILVASGPSLLMFDMRKYEKSILIREEDTSITACSEEINDVDIQNISKHLIAAADDCGNISIIEKTSNGLQITRRLSRVHTNICSCVAFHPRLRYDLVSGGFDSTICFWDISRGRPKGSIDFSVSVSPDPSSSSCQMTNPPFVHKIQYMREGRVVACSLGDGSLRLVSSQGDQELGGVEAHRGMCTTLTRTSEERLMTGGVDGVIRGWRVEEPSPPLGGKQSRGTGKKTGRKTSTHSHQKSVTEVSESCCFSSLWSVDHSKKINDLAFMQSPSEREREISHTSEVNALRLSSRLAVADVTNDITIYDIR